MTAKEGKATVGKRRRGRPPKGTRGDTRQELLDAALQLFARQGYAATTVRQIADEVGVRDSAIYAHFDAKQELLDGLVQEAGPQILDGLAFDFSSLEERDAADALPELVDALVSEWNKPRNRLLMGLLTREGLISGSSFMGPLRKRLDKPFHAWAAAKQVRQDFSIELLIWELTEPLAAIRLLYLNADASRTDRRKGRELAHRHVQYFVSTVVHQR